MGITKIWEPAKEGTRGSMCARTQLGYHDTRSLSCRYRSFIPRGRGDVGFGTMDNKRCCIRLSFVDSEHNDQKASCISFRACRSSLFHFPAQARRKSCPFPIFGARLADWPIYHTRLARNRTRRKLRMNASRLIQSFKSLLAGALPT